jgi:hypothetical protein
MKQVLNQKAEGLEKKLKSIWDIEEHYWYPLNDCKREDVIAFNSEYIEDIESKVSDIQNILVEQNIYQILEMHEDRTVYVIESKSLDPSYDGLYGEMFWFNENMDWIIYASHEGSITFGGRELISSLKRKWLDWESNLFPL